MFDISFNMDYELNKNLGGLIFTQDADGNWGYKAGGADTVHPFNGGKISKLDSFTTQKYGSNTQGVETKTIDISQKTAAYKSLTDASFCVCIEKALTLKNNIADTATRTATQSVSHTYDATSGILTVNFTYRVPANMAIGPSEIAVYGSINVTE